MGYVGKYTWYIKIDCNNVFGVKCFLGYARENQR